jgi:hypothetical protein
MPDFPSWVDDRQAAVLKVLNLAAPACLCYAVYAWLFSFYVSDAALAICGFVISTALITAMLILRKWCLDARNVILIIGSVVLALAERQHLIWMSHVGEPDEYNFTYGGCARDDRPFTSGTGSVAFLRQVECTGIPGADLSRDYFIFVRGPGENHNDSRSLVLSYRAWSEDLGWRFEPVLTWTKSDTLQVGMRSPSVVWLKRDKLDAMKILFVTGGLDIGDDYRLVPCINGAQKCIVRYENDNFATVIDKP